MVTVKYLTVQGESDGFDLAMAVRRAVFVEEQGVPEDEEWDCFDAIARHIICLEDGTALGTLRYYADEGWLHIGRVAVLENARGRGLGRELMRICLAAGREMGLEQAFLNAQTDKMGFYRSLGFAAVGVEFMESGIPHYRMEMTLIETA